MYIYVYIHIYMHTHIYIYVYIYTYAYIHTSVCIYIYICIYRYTYYVLFWEAVIEIWQLSSAQLRPRPPSTPWSSRAPSFWSTAAAFARCQPMAGGFLYLRHTCAYRYIYTDIYTLYIYMDNLYIHRIIHAYISVCIYIYVHR